MKIERKLDEIKSKNVLVIGDIMLDKYYFGVSKRISPEAPVPIMTKKSEKVVLGGAANVAFNLQKANQNVHLMSVIGDDLQGEELKLLLKKNNINDDLVIKDPTRCTTVKTRLVGQNSAQMFRLDEENVEPVNKEITQYMLELLERNMHKYDIVVISDYKKGVLTVENTPKIIDIANKYKKKVLVDIKEPIFEKYKNAFLIKPNLEELKDITKRKADTQEEITLAAQELRKQTNSTYVLVTRGKDGMTLVGNDMVEHIKCASREVYDVSGAGDTVISYVAVGLLNEFELLDTVQIANYAAGVEVSKFGTYAVRIDDIKEYVSIDNNVQFENKVVNLEQLIEILKHKGANRVVFTNGCFDLFHVGHARYLREASNLGDILVVGVNSDASVKRLKGKERPILSQKDRTELLASLSFVSYVIVFDEDTPINLIEHIKPDIITKGGDYQPGEVVGKDIVEKYGGKVIICPYIQSKSTTEIIEKIKKGE